MNYGSWLRAAEVGQVAAVTLLHGAEPFLIDEAIARITRALIPEAAELVMSRDVLEAREAGAEGIVRAAQTFPWGAARRVVFFGVKRFAVGGERMSLYTLENDVIRPLGDERVHFALNCMSVSCPRLPREPFRPAGLDKLLDAKAREFFGERRNLEVLPERRRVRVSGILKFYREDFLAKSPTIIAYINRYASSAIPDDYEVEFIDYDWTVNAQSRYRD